MKRATLSLLAVVMLLAGISASLALTPVVGGTKQLTLEPGASGYTEVEWTYQKQIKVTAKADRGKVQIRVVDGNGRTVARGVNKVSFRSGDTQTTYTATFKNNTNKTQRITASWIIIES